MNNSTNIFVPVLGGMQQRTGYINPETNQTFLDPEFQQRIPVGTVVNTVGGQYRMTANGGTRHIPQTPFQPASQMSGFNLHAGNMRGLSNTALNSALRQNNTMTEAAIRDYQNMARTVNDSAEERARAAYIQRLRSKNNLPRLLRASGITGGAAESTTARMSSGFDNMQFDIMRDRENSLFDLTNRQAAARLRGRQNEENIRSRHALQQMNLEQSLHNQQLQARQLDQTDFDRRRGEMIATLPQFGNDFQAQINYLNVHGDPYNLIPHLHVLRNQKIAGINEQEQLLHQQQLVEEQQNLNQWVANVSHFPSNEIYNLLLEMGYDLDLVTRSALQAAFNLARERERVIGIQQAGEIRSQEAHDSNMTTQELRRMIDELMLPGALEGQRASNANTWSLINNRN